MRSWNVLQEREHGILLNGTGTVVRKHRSIPYGTITSLMSKMEEIDFPVSFTDGLREIYLTYLKDNLEGDYNDSVIRLGCNRKLQESLHRTFVHEVGHYVDEQEGYSDRTEIIEEWRRRQFSMLDMHYRMGTESDGPSEYVAIGFEMHYCDPDGLCKERHPMLYKAVQEACEKNRNK